jgi:hypothetical protein
VVTHLNFTSIVKYLGASILSINNKQVILRSRPNTNLSVFFFTFFFWDLKSFMVQTILVCNQTTPTTRWQKICHYPFDICIPQLCQYGHSIMNFQGWFLGYFVSLNFTLFEEQTFLKLQPNLLHEKTFPMKSSFIPLNLGSCP